MTDNDWDAIAETLATEVMGWRIVPEDEEIRMSDDDIEYWDDGHVMWCNKWKPHHDLNQAVGCAEAVGSWSVNYLYHTGDYRANIHNDPEGEGEDLYSQNHTGSPAKAICLAVLRAIGEEPSDYEEVTSDE